jgi:pyridoxine kinase
VSRVLILSSYVAASRVGGFSQTHDFDDRDVWSCLAPTVLFGRHPGLGAPGGGAIPDAMFADIIAGIEGAEGGARFDGVLTGYFASAGQVEIAAAALDRAVSVNPSAILLVDPILGDAPKGLYVKPEVAAALRQHLLPRATILTPNAWEAEFLTGIAANTPDGALTAAKALGKPTIVTSVAKGDRLGALYWTGSEAWFAHAPRKEGDIKGAGDALAADFLTQLLWETAPKLAIQRAVSGVAGTKAVVERLAI